MGSGRERSPKHVSALSRQPPPQRASRGQSRQASGGGRYFFEALVTTLFGRIPTVVGIGMRAVVYRLILRMDGTAAIENGVRLRFADNIRLGEACPLVIQFEQLKPHVFNRLLAVADVLATAPDIGQRGFQFA